MQQTGKKLSLTEYRTRLQNKKDEKYTAINKENRTKHKTGKHNNIKRSIKFLKQQIEGCTNRKKIEILTKELAVTTGKLKPSETINKQKTKRGGKRHRFETARDQLLHLIKFSSSEAAIQKFTEELEKLMQQECQRKKHNKKIQQEEKIKTATAITPLQKQNQSTKTEKPTLKKITETKIIVSIPLTKLKLIEEKQQGHPPTSTYTTPKITTSQYTTPKLTTYTYTSPKTTPYKQKYDPIHITLPLGIPSSPGRNLVFDPETNTYITNRKIHYTDDNIKQKFNFYEELDESFFK